MKNLKEKRGNNSPIHINHTILMTRILKYVLSSVLLAPNQSSLTVLMKKSSMKTAPNGRMPPIRMVKSGLMYQVLALDVLALVLAAAPLAFSALSSSSLKPKSTYSWSSLATIILPHQVFRQFVMHLNQPIELMVAHNV